MRLLTENIVIMKACQFVQIFFNKFCLFNVNLSVQIYYPKDNDEKINGYKMSLRMLILEYYKAIKLIG